jgi:hypothetical protein
MQQAVQPPSLASTKFGDSPELGCLRPGVQESTDKTRGMAGRRGTHTGTSRLAPPGTSLILRLRASWGSFSRRRVHRGC